MRRHSGELTARREYAAGWLSEDAVVEFAAVLTLVLVAIHTEGALRWVVMPAVAVGAISHRARVHAGLWLVIGLVRLIGQVPFAWYAIDNHQYLLTYWCFALALALAGPRALDVMRSNARLLIGLAFAFATVWKVISPDFIDGSLFEYILVAEHRVTTLSAPILGIEPVTDEDLSAVVSVVLGHLPPQAVPVGYGGELGRAPSILAVTTVALEAGVAISFLVPLGQRTWVRDAFLLVFLWTTYLITPVIGFGMVLAAMGYVQTAGAGRRRVYLVTFAALPLFVAVTAVPRFPPGFGLALVGALALLVYLIWSSRSVLIAGCALLGGGLGAVLGGGALTAATIVGVAGGLVAMVLLDLAAGRPISRVLIVAAGVVGVLGAVGHLM
jgi:hypothetical protein